THNDYHVMAHALDNLGWTLGELSDYRCARSAHTEALTLHLEVDNGLGAANSLSWLGHWALDEGDLKAARSFSERSLALLRDLGDTSVLTYMHTCHDLAIEACEEGDFSGARVFLDQALNTARVRNDPFAIVRCLETYAGAAALQKHASRALRLAGAAAAM